MNRLRSRFEHTFSPRPLLGRSAELGSYACGVGFALFGLQGLASVVSTPQSAFLGALVVVGLSLAAIALGVLIHQGVAAPSDKPAGR